MRLPYDRQRGRGSISLFSGSTLGSAVRAGLHPTELLDQWIAHRKVLRRMLSGTQKVIKSVIGGLRSCKERFRTLALCVNLGARPACQHKADLVHEIGNVVSHVEGLGCTS